MSNAVHEINKSQILTLTEARQLFDKPPSKSAICKWANPSVGYGMERIVLETIPDGPRRLTTPEMIEAFREARNASADRVKTKHSKCPPHDVSMRNLRRMGLVE